MKARTILWGLTLAGGAAIVGRAALRTSEGPQVDAELFSMVNRGHGPGADRFFGGVTELGSLYAAGAAAGALALTGERRTAIRALSAAGFTWLLGQAAKKLVVRSRPFQADPDGTRRMIAEPAGTSWPSSHPAVLTTFTRVAARDLGLGVISRSALSALDASVATSRVYLGVHYPSDVVSGLLMGRAVARLWPGAKGR
ncbi:MAG: phosphatase PAP2 family protein [Actinomycetota bacterium]|nr:phosphatase PAP2 family protein [Actinomycetota bacterium]